MNPQVKTRTIGVHLRSSAAHDYVFPASESTVLPLNFCEPNKIGSYSEHAKPAAGGYTHPLTGRHLGALPTTDSME